MSNDYDHMTPEERQTVHLGRIADALEELVELLKPKKKARPRTTYGFPFYMGDSHSTPAPEVLVDYSGEPGYDELHKLIDPDRRQWIEKDQDGDLVLYDAEDGVYGIDWEYEDPDFRG